MKPLTRAEADVLQLSAQLPTIDEKRFYDIYGDLNFDAADNIGYNCYAMNCKRMVYLNQCYVLVFQAIKGYQVIRRFICETRIRIPMGYIGERTKEIAQLWMTPRGEIVQLAKPKTRTRLVCGWRHDYWATGAEFRASVNVNYEMFCYKDEVCSDMSPTIFVDSLSKTFLSKMNCIPFNDDVLDVIDNSCNHYRKEINVDKRVVEAIDQSGIKFARIYSSLLVAISHKYDLVGNISKWLQLVSTMLMVKGADLHQPKYICPTDIDSTIEFFKRKLKRQKEKEEAEARRKIAMEQMKDSEEYRKNMQRFLCIKFDTETLQFHVLQDVAEFYLEGEAMHHCVYARKYYRKFSSLILSCTDKRTGKRVSTIEIDLKTMTVVQNYAACDEVPKNDKEIRSIVADNIYRIKNAA